jgi:hypothetical protein
MPTNYELIKDYIELSSPKPMLAKYDPPVSVPGGNGFRRLWPHVLGKSAVPGDATTKIEVVLCRQYHPPAFAGWKCLKVQYMTDIGDVSGTQPPPDADMTEEEKDRQSCVEDVEVWR